MTLAQAKDYLRTVHPSLDVIRGGRGGYLWLFNGEPLVHTDFGWLDDLVVIVTELTKRHLCPER